MPWNGPGFAAKHNHSLHGKAADEAGSVATAMINRGVPESEAIATANKRANAKKLGKALREKHT